MLNLKLIRYLKFNDRTYVHYMKNIDVSYITNDRSRNLITVNLHVGGSYKKFDTFDILTSENNIDILDRIGEHGLSDSMFTGTLVVNHDTGDMSYIEDEFARDVYPDNCTSTSK